MRKTKKEPLLPIRDYIAANYTGSNARDIDEVYGVGLPKVRNQITYMRKLGYPLPKSRERAQPIGATRVNQDGRVQTKTEAGWVTDRSSEKLFEKHHRKFSEYILAHYDATNAAAIAKKFKKSRSSVITAASKMKAEGRVFQQVRLSFNRAKPDSLKTLSGRKEPVFKTLENRDAGKVLVRVSRNMEKLVTPERRAEMEAKGEIYRV